MSTTSKRLWWTPRRSSLEILTNLATWANTLPMITRMLRKLLTRPHLSRTNHRGKCPSTISRASKNCRILSRRLLNFRRWSNSTSLNREMFKMKARNCKGISKMVEQLIRRLMNPSSAKLWLKTNRSLSLSSTLAIPKSSDHLILPSSTRKWSNPRMKVKRQRDYLIRRSLKDGPCSKTRNLTWTGSTILPNPISVWCRRVTKSSTDISWSTKIPTELVSVFRSSQNSSKVRLALYYLQWLSRLLVVNNSNRNVQSLIMRQPWCIKPISSIERQIKI